MRKFLQTQTFNYAETFNANQGTVIIFFLLKGILVCLSQPVSANPRKDLPTNFTPKTILNGAIIPLPSTSMFPFQKPVSAKQEYNPGFHKINFT